MIWSNLWRKESGKRKKWSDSIFDAKRKYQFLLKQKVYCACINISVVSIKIHFIKNCFQQIESNGSKLFFILKSIKIYLSKPWGMNQMGTEQRWTQAPRQTAHHSAGLPGTNWAASCCAAGHGLYNVPGQEFPSDWSGLSSCPEVHKTIWRHLALHSEKT